MKENSTITKVILEEVKGLSEEEGKKILDFIQRFKYSTKLKKSPLKPNRQDPLENVIGCCNGPTDLSKKHDLYIYGNSL